MQYTDIAKFIRRDNVIEVMPFRLSKEGVYGHFNKFNGRVMRNRLNEHRFKTGHTTADNVNTDRFVTNMLKREMSDSEFRWWKLFLTMAAGGIIVFNGCLNEVAAVFGLFVFVVPSPEGIHKPPFLKNLSPPTSVVLKKLVIKFNLFLGKNQGETAQWIVKGGTCDF